MARTSRKWKRRHKRMAIAGCGTKALLILWTLNGPCHHPKLHEQVIDFQDIINHKWSATRNY
ncbi:hypothetical protein M413DRAFT_196832 [Hebeloma cylindrosporum]|uniref:Uncharacterized protein n=1 Tax=Hebeloma cylindrosporum TaxID=76867 RepID=A0A0C3BRI4_HEBCY|nr:hypothetical protein M413DRAFT_196832 [Hebeloma cylindrosporum h7]